MDKNLDKGSVVDVVWNTYDLMCIRHLKSLLKTRKQCFICRRIEEGFPWGIKHGQSTLREQ
jgi:hypothetical protein